MYNEKLLEDYMKRTGQTEQQVYSGLMAYGFDKTFELLAEAQKLNKTLVFYYKNKRALENDTPSYKFE